MYKVSLARRARSRDSGDEGIPCGLAVLMSQELARAFRSATDLINKAPDEGARIAAAQDFHVTVEQKMVTHGVANLTVDARHALKELRAVIERVLGSED